MTTLHCAIYVDVSPPSQYVYYFFEAKKTDDFVFLGWAKCNISPEEGGYASTYRNRIPYI